MVSAPEAAVGSSLTASISREVPLSSNDSLDQLAAHHPSGAGSMTELGMIPAPVSASVGDGLLELPARVTAIGPREWVDIVECIVSPGSGLRLEWAGTSRAEHPAALLRLVTDTALRDGAYRLRVDASGVEVVAGETAGLLYALATLRQLLPAWACGLAPLPGAPLTLPHVAIEDTPRFAWRGLHLDVGRHFQPLASLFRLVDLMSLHKLDMLHLHLSDDQGWRFEVRAYPRLTEVGSWRTETRKLDHEQGDGTPHGGFYTQEQLRALVGYAAQRGITVVPEIDVPGHVRALLAAYPELGEDLDGTGFTVATEFGVFEEVLHLTDETVSMIENIFEELLDVFPSKYIHIGGDECPTTQWERSKAAQQLADDRGLAGVHELQPWFTSHLRDWLAERGRRLVGWDEIIDHGEVPDAVVMSWRGTEPGVRALDQGNEVVMTPRQATYFDYYQAKPDGEPYAIGGFTSWEHVLAYDPAEGVSEEHTDRLLGVQAQLWTECLPTPEHVQYMAFPRLAALAEVAWAQRPADEHEFRDRLRHHLTRLDASGVAYRPLDGPHPWQIRDPRPAVG